MKPRIFAKRGPSTPSWWTSLIPIFFLVGIMSLVIKCFGADVLGGASQLSLILSSGVVAALAIFIHGCPWKRLESSIADNIRSIAGGILILLMIGAISGSWMVSGIVPTMICYGLDIISPRIFLFAVCLICTLVSLITGSSWTTIATIGVALIGIGDALGYSPAWTAGAIISGAYFGDKISPLSDTTVLASSVAEVPLFNHIKYMMITTLPSFVITLVVFLAASICHMGSEVAQVDTTAQILKDTFFISPWLMIVPVLTSLLIIRRVPTFLTLLSACLMACATALIFQKDIIMMIAGADNFDFLAGMKGIMISCFGTTSIETGNAILDELITTHGMNGMMPTIMLILCAATFGGVLIGSGMIQSLTDKLTESISSRTAIVSSTVGTGIFANMTMGDQYLSIILTCNLYRKLFEDKGYEGRLLSRSTEDSATVTSVLIPWSSCGMTQSTVLHVPTIDYLPYCLFNIISPLMSILVSATGYKIIRNKKS